MNETKSEQEQLSKAQALDELLGFDPIELWESADDSLSNSADSCSGCTGCTCPP